MSGKVELESYNAPTVGLHQRVLEKSFGYVVFVVLLILGGGRGGGAAPPPCVNCDLCSYWGVGPQGLKSDPNKIDGLRN